MLGKNQLQDTSANLAKYGDIYRFKLDNFWSGKWISGEIKEETENEFVRLTKKEYLRVVSEIPESGCVSLHPKSHAALYQLLLSRKYSHFGITGIKTLYFIMCIEGLFGKKYEKITTHEYIKKLIGGRADCSHASDKFWAACYERIKMEDISERVSLREYTEAEREIWRGFVRRSSISCNRKKGGK